MKSCDDGNYITSNCWGLKILPVELSKSQVDFGQFLIILQRFNDMNIDNRCWSDFIDSSST